MRIRMLTSVLGAVDGHQSPSAGDELEVSDPAGQAMCRKGIAEPVAVTPTSTRKRAETRKD